MRVKLSGYPAAAGKTSSGNQIVTLFSIGWVFFLLCHFHHPFCLAIWFHLFACLIRAAIFRLTLAIVLFRLSL